LGIGPYPWRISLRMGLAKAGLEPEEEEIAFRARIFASLFRFVWDPLLGVRRPQDMKESHYH